ncbi:MAG: hypothetical protein F6J87_19705 [Spirulina sp. SIO3F2]|nr:hypothetical protein [Spirulina sp. SIO3F2]
MATKAKRTQIQLGDHILDGFMLPDGSYRLSLKQAAEMIGLKTQNASDFLRSKAIERLLGKESTDQKNLVEIDSGDQATGGSRIRALSLGAVSAYWLWQTYRGNKQALALCMALITESLERRFDKAFGIERSEFERNERLQSQLNEMWEVLKDVGEELAVGDDIRRERDYFGELLKQNGIDPYKLPEE